jgi:hypothetical protein
VAEGIGAKMAASQPSLFDRTFAPATLWQAASFPASENLRNTGRLRCYSASEWPRVTVSRQMFAHIPLLVARRAPPAAARGLRDDT